MDDTISRKAAIDALNKLRESTYEVNYQRWWNGALESVIDNAPTVIEAEGSEA